MTDRLIRHLTTAAVLLVAALAATVSYVHIRDLAITHGGDRLTSALLPLLIDGTVAAMSCVMLRAARLEGVRTPWLARFMLGLSVGATLAANMAYGAAYGVSGALLWTCPAVFFVGCVEVSVAMVRRTRPVAEPVKRDRPAEMAEKKTELAALKIERATLEAGQMADRLTVKQQAKRAGVSERTMYRRLAKADMVAVNGNGKH